MLHEVPALRGCESQINGLDEMRVIFQVAAENLLREFVGLQPSLGCDLRQLRFLFGLEANFHGFSLGRRGKDCQIDHERESEVPTLPISSISFFSESRSSVASGRLRNRLILRSSRKNA